MTSNNQDYKRDFFKEEILFDKKILVDKNICKRFFRIARKGSDTNTHEFQ